MSFIAICCVYRSALRNWLFQVSKDGKNWTTLYTHTDDNSLNEPGYDTFTAHVFLIGTVEIWSGLTFKVLVLSLNFKLFYFSSTASWPLEPPQDSEGWRHVRLQQAGKNASGQTHYLSLSGFEVYGTVIGAVEEPLGQFLDLTVSFVLFLEELAVFNALLRDENVPNFAY